jgi:lipoate-protein ligase B
MALRPLSVAWLGRVPYAEALARQQDAVAERMAGAGHDVLLLLEHPTVITMGRSSDAAHLRWSAERLCAEGIEIHHIARGGDVTLHAPGQLVGYLVMDLRARCEPDLHRFVRRMETALIAALGSLGLRARRVEGRTGVFMAATDAAGGEGRDRKIASIGVGVRRWVTYHGFALNVTTDLEAFEAIVPCGLADVEMTSVARELGCGPLGLDARVRDRVARAFVSEFAGPHDAGRHPGSTRRRATPDLG